MNLPRHFTENQLTQLDILDSILDIAVNYVPPSNISLLHFEIPNKNIYPLSMLPCSAKYAQRCEYTSTPKFSELYRYNYRDFLLKDKITSSFSTYGFIRYFYAKHFLMSGISDYTNYSNRTFHKIYLKLTDMDLRLFEEILMYPLHKKLLPTNLNRFRDIFITNLSLQSLELLTELYTNIKYYRDRHIDVYAYIC